MQGMGGGVSPKWSSPQLTPGPRQVRTASIGFEAAAPLKPGEKMTIRAMPQCPFRGERLVVPDEYKDASIHSVQVGAREQLVSTTPLAASAYSPSSRVPMQIDTASVAQMISLVVSRPNGGPFRAVLVGSAAIDGEPLPPSMNAPVPEPLVEEAVLAAKEIDEAYEPGVTLEELEALGVLKQ